MKIKHIKTSLVTLGFVLVGSLLFNAVILSDNAAADFENGSGRCPNGTDWAKPKVVDGKTKYFCPGDKPAYIPKDGDKCDDGGTYHADRKECYKEKTWDVPNASVGDQCIDPNDNGYRGEVQNVNGTKKCVTFKKTDGKPTGVGQPPAEPAPEQRAEEFCDEQFDGAQADICKKGVGGDTCASYTPGSVDANACQTGAMADACNQEGERTSQKASAELKCYADVQKCFDENASSNNALSECISKARNIDKAAAQNYFNKRKAGDAGTCGQARTNLITCTGDSVGALADVLRTILFILTVLIGIVAVGGIVYGAVLYASAEDNSGQTSKAKGIIRDVAIGLVLYGLMIALINWLIPGGVIG